MGCVFIGLGTLLALAAIILATLPWPRGAFRR